MDLKYILNDDPVPPRRALSVTSKNCEAGNNQCSVSKQRYSKRCNVKKHVGIWTLLSRRMCFADIWQSFDSDYQISIAHENKKTIFMPILRRKVYILSLRVPLYRRCTFGTFLSSESHETRYCAFSNFSFTKAFIRFLAGQIEDLMYLTLKIESLSIFGFFTFKFNFFDLKETKLLWYSSSLIKVQYY